MLWSTLTTMEISSYMRKILRRASYWDIRLLNHRPFRAKEESQEVLNLYILTDITPTSGYWSMTQSLPTYSRRSYLWNLRVNLRPEIVKDFSTLKECRTPVNQTADWSTPILTFLRIWDTGDSLVIDNAGFEMVYRKGIDTLLVDPSNDFTIDTNRNGDIILHEIRTNRNIVLSQHVIPSSRIHGEEGRLPTTSTTQSIREPSYTQSASPVPYPPATFDRWARFTSTEPQPTYSRRPNI